MGGKRVTTKNHQLVSIDEETYLAVIRELLENHSRSVRAKNDHELKSKLLRFGLSRGFEKGLLYDLLF